MERVQLCNCGVLPLLLRPLSFRSRTVARRRRRRCCRSPYRRFGTVFKATLRGEYEVAVKTMRVSKISHTVLAKFKAELLILAPVHHQNLVHLHGGVWNEGADKLCIVLEFCPHGSFNTYLKREQGTWEGLHHGLALGTARCLRYLHHELSEPLIHRDVKPDNVLVGEGIVAKLADFGESTHFDKKAAKRNTTAHIDALSMTMVGTKIYMAPEILRGERYNESVVSLLSKHSVLLWCHNLVRAL